MSRSHPPTAARCAPAVARNREAIAEVLAAHLPKTGLVLEIASGTGEHAKFFAERFPALTWQPSDIGPAALKSIAAWQAHVGLKNFQAPVALDVHQRPWPILQADSIININMIHISPWSACEALFQGASEVLSPGGILFMYGPYSVDGVHTAPSNAAFDAHLKSQDPQFGVRDLTIVKATAERFGFCWQKTYPMPANNFSVVYRRQ